MSPASTRWCPTPEQVMILQEFYRAGIRTPNAIQIQQITCYLSYHGKIEGKNVFYWFQNHKARERQKLRKTFSKHYCQLSQIQLLNSTSCQLLHGLRRSTSTTTSVRPHQAPFCRCNHESAAAVTAKYYQNPKWAISRNYRERNCGNELGVPDNNFMIREYDRSWMVSESNRALCFSSRPKSSLPLQTLQLFPSKGTILRQESILLNNQFQPSL